MKLLKILTAISMLALAGSAHAAFVSCVGPNVTVNQSYNIGDNVSSATDCTILAPLNANVNDSVAGGNAAFASFTVNVEQFFGINNWRFDGRYNIGVSETGSFFDFTGGGQSGSFSLLGSLPTNTDIMLVFKDGSNTNLVGYRVSGAGTYVSPFEEPPFSFSASGPRDVSHISVYYRVNGGTGPQCGVPGTPPCLTNVPEPGSLALASLALLGLGISTSRRRRRV